MPAAKEGNGFAPPRCEYPGLLALVRETQPAQCTLVPDSDAQITSDHGFDMRADARRLKPLIADLKAVGARVSLFVDAGCAEVEVAADVGADRIEIYTGPFAHAFARGDHARELAACVATAQRAKEAGLGVNAGHDLNQANLAVFCTAIPFLAALLALPTSLLPTSLLSGSVFDPSAVSAPMWWCEPSGGWESISRPRSTPKC